MTKFQDFQKSLPHSSGMDWNPMNDEELGSIGLLRFKYRRGDQIIEIFWKIGCPPEMMSGLFNLLKFGNPGRSTPESYKMHWKLINGLEFGSIKLPKLKYRR